MNDKSILDHIGKLVAEEQQLREGSLDPSAASRLRHVAEELDRCWDLLRQRRAKRDAGQDPDTATERDARTVEGYVG
jgi:hypothetical protein